jgi:hypothetical protein
MNTRRAVQLEADGLVPRRIRVEWAWRMPLIFAAANGSEQFANIAVELSFRALKRLPMQTYEEIGLVVGVQGPTAFKAVQRVAATGLFDMPSGFVQPLYFATARHLAERVIAEKPGSLGQWADVIQTAAAKAWQRRAKHELTELQADRWIVVADWVITERVLQWDSVGCAEFAQRIRDADTRLGEGFDVSTVHGIVLNVKLVVYGEGEGDEPEGGGDRSDDEAEDGQLPTDGAAAEPDDKLEDDPQLIDDDFLA